MIFHFRWLLTPFRDNGHLSRQEVNNNNKHAKTDQTIERAFGLLKGRWRRLKFIEMETLMSVQLLWQQPVFYIIFAYLLMKRTLMNFWISLMVMMVITIVNYQLMFQDHKLLQREIKCLSFSTTNTCNQCYNCKQLCYKFRYIIICMYLHTFLFNKSKIEQ